MGKNEKGIIKIKLQKFYAQKQVWKGHNKNALC